MLAAIFMFSAMDVLAKTLSATYPVPQVVWARYAGQVALTVLVLRARALPLLRTRHIGMQLTRSVFLFAATCCLFTSFSFMDIASATAVMNIHPVLLTLGAAVFLAEPLGIKRLVGILAALVGALIVIRPGADVFSWAALLPLLAGIFYASYALTTRMLGRDEDILTSFLYTALVGAVAATFLAVPVWQTPTAGTWVLFAALGGAGAIGQFLLIRALTVTQAGVVAPFGYAGILLATIWGVIVFDEWPDAWTLLGAATIILAGIFVWYRETRARPVV